MVVLRGEARKAWFTSRKSYVRQGRNEEKKIEDERSRIAATAEEISSTEADGNATRKLDEFEQELVRRAVTELPPWDSERNMSARRIKKKSNIVTPGQYASVEANDEAISEIRLADPEGTAGKTDGEIYARLSGNMNSLIDNVIKTHSDEFMDVLLKTDAPSKINYERDGAYTVTFKHADEIVGKIRVPLDLDNKDVDMAWTYEPGSKLADAFVARAIQFFWDTHVPSNIRTFDTFSDEEKAVMFDCVTAQNDAT